MVEEDVVLCNLVDFLLLCLSCVWDPRESVELLGPEASARLRGGEATETTSPEEEESREFPGAFVDQLSLRCFAATVLLASAASTAGLDDSICEGSSFDAEDVDRRLERPVEGEGEGEAEDGEEDGLAVPFVSSLSFSIFRVCVRFSGPLCVDDTRARERGWCVPSSLQQRKGGTRSRDERERERESVRATLGRGCAQRFWGHKNKHERQKRRKKKIIIGGRKKEPNKGTANKDHTEKHTSIPHRSISPDRQPHPTPSSSQHDGTFWISIR